MFRIGIVLLLLLLLLLAAGGARGHIADEAWQASASIRITDTWVDVVTTLPARYAFPELFDGASPIEMDMLEPSEMAKRVEVVVAGRNPVTIDGVEVRPVIMGPKVDMINSTLPARAFSESQVMRLGNLIYLARYETKSPPRRVSIVWDMFVPEYAEDGQALLDVPPAPVVSFLNVDGKQQIVVFSEDEPGYTWHSDQSALVPGDLLATPAVEREYLRLPVLSACVVLGGLVLGFAGYRRSRGVGAAAAVCGLVLGGVLLPFGRLSIETTPELALPGEAEAVEVFKSLHANIYRAFDYTDEGAIYDALSRSVDGPMLETIYNDVYQSLIMRDQGGAVSKVQKVDVRSAEVLERFESEASTPPDEEAGSYLVKASWTVDGLVQHYGHTHTRTNAFEAVYTVAPRGGQWRIVEAEVLEQRRTDDGKQFLGRGGVGGEEAADQTGAP